MVKYIVLWAVVNSWIVPCDFGPITSYDEYGQRHDRNSMTLQVCYDSETVQMEKKFVLYEEAVIFIDGGKKRGIEDFRIEKVITESVGFQGEN